jgi:hypothetical protein
MQELRWSVPSMAGIRGGMLQYRPLLLEDRRTLSQGGAFWRGVYVAAEFNPAELLEDVLAQRYCDPGSGIYHGKPGLAQKMPNL